MTKPVIVTRLGKGSELTFQEGDDNFTNLRDATINISADSGSTQIVELNGTIQIAGGTGVSTAANNGVITVTGFDGDFNSLSNIPQVAAVALSGDYNDLSNTPSLATVATSGAYSDLSGTPSLATVATSGAYSDLSGTPSLATVATSGSYTDLSDKPTIPTDNTELTNGAGYITGIDSSAVTTALGFTPENSANKNANNGYAGLDANGLVPASILPSYVDDVLEFADVAAFPSTGETGKIFVAVDTGKIYRWSGSAYVEISASPGSTDAVTEGATNLYFTQQRARDSVSAGTGISYDPSTGVITSTVSPGIASVSADTTPALGGNLNVAGNSIVSVSNGNITLAPNGSGKVVLSGIQYPDVNGTNGQVLTTNGSGVASWQDAAGGGGNPIVALAFSSAAVHSGTTIKPAVTETVDTANICTISSTYNFTLPAGTYLIQWQPWGVFNNSFNDNIRPTTYQFTTVSGDSDITNVGEIIPGLQTVGERAFLWISNRQVMTLTQTSTFFFSYVTSNTPARQLYPRFLTFVKTA
jgi:hypothetical protein